MSLLDAELRHGKQWTRVGDWYEVTKKPRGLELSGFPVIPFATMDSIPEGGAYAPRFELRAPETIASGTYFQRGDVLVAKITPSFENGKQALALDLPGEFGYATTEVIPLHRRQDRGDARMLFFYLLHPDIRHHVAERMEGSTGRQRVPENVLLDLPIPLLDSDEEVAIANVLETIQSAASANVECAANARRLKHAAMHTLFTREMNGEVQNEADISVQGVPGGWSRKQLGEIAEITYGAQAAVANATDPSVGTLILTNVNLDLEGHINLEKKRYYHVPEAYRERLSLRKGDVLFNWRSGSANHIGKTVYFDLDGDHTYSSFILRFRPHSHVSNRYLYWWLTHLRIDGFFTAQRNVSSINSVYNASLSATIPIWYPDNDRQREIVEILDAIEHKINLHRRKRAVFDDLFTVLLHKLVTGEIRASDLDMSALGPKQFEEVKA
jgi:type I restriction enzyme S subunit